MQKRNRHWKWSAALALAVAPVVKAQVVTSWTGLGGDNLWTTVGNWDQGAPTGIDGAQFNGAGNGVTGISLGGTVQPITAVLFNGSAAGYNLGVTAGDTFSFAAGGSIAATVGLTNAQLVSAALQTNGNLFVTNAVASGATTGAGLIGTTLAGPVTMNAGGTFTVTNTGANVTTVLGGNIADVAGTPGALSLIATTAGGSNNNNFILNGNNTYTGGTTINVNTGSNGSIQIGTDSPFGTGKVTNNLVTGTSSPQLQALGGTRTISNAFDLNGGLTFVGSNGFTFTGPLVLINGGPSSGQGASRTFNNAMTNLATITLGSASSPSTFTLGNPADGGGKTVVLTGGSNSTFVLNDVFRDPVAGGGTAGGSVQLGGSGKFVVNSLNTYTGTTTLTGAGVLVQFNHDFNPGDTAGPFGTGLLITNNTTTSPILQPVGGNRVLNNPIQMTSAFVVSNATGDTSSLTLTGPITAVTTGRTINNNMGTNATLTLGAAASPSTITLSPTNGTSMTFGGSGITVVNDLILNSPTWTGNVTVSGSGTFWATNANTYTGTTTLNGGATIIPISLSTAGPAGAPTSGPLGAGTIVFNNGANQHMRPIGLQTLGNPITMSSGFAMDNTPGDNISSLTFSGPVSMPTSGGSVKFISNGFSGATANSGGTMFLGDAASPSTITLPSNGTAAMGIAFASVAGPVVINDVIKDPAGSGFTNTVNYNPETKDVTGLITVNGASTYTGNTLLGGGTQGGGIVSLGVSSVLSGGNIVSGPFGKGTVIMNQTVANPTVAPTGADRTVANAISLTSGFIAANPAGAFNLTLTGAITTGTNAATAITSNMATNTALTLGSAATPSTITLSTVAGQPLQIGGTGATVVNDVVVDATGTPGGLLVSGGTVTLNAANTYTGGTTVNGGTLRVSSDANLGDAAGAVTLGGGTLLATGSFTSARAVNLNATPSAVDATAGNTLTLTGALAGAGTLTKGASAGTVTLAQAGAVNLAGDVTVNGGTLAVGNATTATALTVGGTLNVANGGKATLGVAGTAPAAVTHSVNNLVLNTTGTLDVNQGVALNSANNSLASVRSALAANYTGGTWSGTTGIVSSSVQADVPHKSIAYVSGANPLNSTINPSLTNTATIYVRPALVGDFNLDGVVDRFDVRSFNAHNAFNDGQSNHDWADGDLNYDGVVDRFDVRAFNGGNNFNSGTTFGSTPAGAVAAAAHSSSLTASPAAIGNTTTVGTTGDGKPDLIYNPTTGDVTLSYDGFTLGSGQSLVEVDVQSAKGSLKPLGANHSAAATVTPTTADVDYANFGTSIADGTDLGTIFPTGSTAAALTNGDIKVNLYLNGELVSSRFADIIGGAATPEPTSLALAGVAAVGLLSRKRRKA